MGSGRGRGRGSSGLDSGLQVVGAHCSTAPRDSPPLTGGSWPETWSGAGVWSQVWGSATPYLEVWRGLDCVKPHLNAAAARPSTILSLVRLGRRSTNERAAWPGGGDGARSFPAGFFPLPGQRVRDRGQMSKFFSFIFLETPLVGRDRKIEARSESLEDTRASLFMAPANICLRRLHSKSHCHLYNSRSAVYGHICGTYCANI